VRWRHDDQGLLQAGEFLDVAAQGDLLVDLGRWVLRRACTDLSRWKQAGALPGGFVVTVNIAHAGLMRADLVTDLQTALRDADVAESHLQLEVAEEDVLQNVSGAEHQFQALRTLGVRVAIDGFGLGNTTMPMLQRLKVNSVKLAPSLVRRVGIDAVADETVRNLVNLADFVSIDLVAVGVENDEQRSTLLGLGVRYAEGFGFTMPLDHNELGRLLTLGAGGDAG
jgi:EAL domain-containing protein (putative c-di-GMP-specific phosphodiesterase class I)